MAEHNDYITKEVASTQGGKNSVTLERAGARIVQLVLNDTITLSRFQRGDGKSGATHPCSPIFGPETTTTYGLHQHGPIRNTVCTVTQEDELSVTLESVIQEGSYPSPVLFRQTVTISPTACTIQTTHINNSEQPAPVNFAEHFYWNAPNGWETVSVNGEQIAEVIKANAVIPLKTENIIQITGQPAIHLRQEGMNVAMLWSYKSPLGGYDTQYACIEPTEGDPLKHYFGTPESIISSGSSRTTMLAISLSQ